MNQQAKELHYCVKWLNGQTIFSARVDTDEGVLQITLQSGVQLSVWHSQPCKCTYLGVDSLDMLIGETITSAYVSCASSGHRPYLTVTTKNITVIVYWHDQNQNLCPDSFSWCTVNTH